MVAEHGEIVNDEDADREVERRISEWLENLALTFRERLELLAGGRSRATRVLLAHVLTSTDGYNPIKDCSYAGLPDDGWHTVFVPDYPSPTLESQSALVFRTRHGRSARWAAVLVDELRPGERLPEKRRAEQWFLSREFKVLLLSGTQILNAPESARTQVEGLLFDLVDETLQESGVIRGRE